MILEERDYHIIPGRMAEFIATYERLGVEIQKAELGELVGHFVSDIGELNHVVALWRYDNIADREERRARMLANPGWADYLTAIKGMIERQSIRILKPTSISPMQ
jgi:hypothetical protein